MAALSDWVPLNYTGTLPNHPWFWKGPKNRARWTPSENWDPTLNTVFVNKTAFLRNPAAVVSVPLNFCIVHAGQAPIDCACPSVNSEELWDCCSLDVACPYKPNLGPELPSAGPGAEGPSAGPFHLTTTFAENSSPAEAKKIAVLVPMPATSKRIKCIAVFSSWQPIFMQQMTMGGKNWLILMPKKWLNTWQDALTPVGIKCHVYSSLHDPILPPHACHIHLAPPGSCHDEYPPNSVARGSFQVVLFYSFLPNEHTLRPKSINSVLMLPRDWSPPLNLNVLRALLPWPECAPLDVKHMQTILPQLMFVLEQVARKITLEWMPKDHIVCRQVDIPVVLLTMCSGRFAPPITDSERFQRLMEKLDICPVCLDDIPLNDVALFPCGHLMCGMCHMKIDKTCPVCRHMSKRKHRRCLNFCKFPDEAKYVVINSSDDGSVAEAISKVPPTDDIRLLIKGDRHTYNSIHAKISERKDMTMYNH